MTEIDQHPSKEDVSIQQMARYCAQYGTCLTDKNDKINIGNIIVNSQLQDYIHQNTDGLRINLDKISEVSPQTIKSIYYIILSKRTKLLSK